MAKISNIYEELYSWDNLYNAYREAGRGKWFRDDVARFTANLEENLIQIQNELMWHTYKVGRYREFYVYEPKKRLVMALQFKDRVVQWAIYRQINDLFDKQFISDSYGCRNGKGSHRAADRLQYWMRAVDRKPGDWYYLKLDISKYFYRVDHRILMDILHRKIDDEDLLWLLGVIVNCEHTAFGLPLGLSPDQCDKPDRLMEVGMPIGNLTSQLFANLYLNELDQFVKHELRLHYYVRYMDDVIILSNDKQQLHEIKDRIETFLNEELRLHLNNKTAIRKTKAGVEFVGFRIFATHRKYKKKSLRKLKSRLKFVAKEYAAGRMTLEKVDATVQSYYGAMQHFNSYGLRRKLLKTVVFKRTTPEGGINMVHKDEGGGGS